MRALHLALSITCFLGLGCSLAQAQTTAEAADLGEAMKSSSSTPKVIVLIHGMSATPTEPSIPGVPEPKVDTLDYTRFYFSYSFARRLLGASSTEGLKTLSGTSVSGAKWDQHGEPDSNGKVAYTIATNESSEEDHFIVPGDFSGTGTPPVSLMLVYRDASKTLMTQTKDAIDQVYTLYTSQFGSEASPKTGKIRPNIIFVGHSMGNLVTRALLSNPSGTVRNESLSARQRLRAGAIRDRTLYLVSLAGPHQGSPLADFVSSIQSGVSTVPAVVKDGLNALSSGLGDGVQQQATSMIMNPAMVDLRTDTWTSLNQGALAPHNSKRSDGTLIPIYTMIGHRNSASLFTNPSDDTQFPLGGITATLASSEPGRRNITRNGAMMVLDWILHNVPSVRDNAWGATTDNRFDKIARYHRKLGGLTLSAAGEDQGAPFGLPKYFNKDHVTRTVRTLFGTKTEVVRTNRDGESDSDGLVAALSGHGWRLGTSTNNFFAHTSEFSQPSGTDIGSWYRIHSDDMPWEFTSHETIHRSADTGGWIRENIVNLAGPLCAQTGVVSVWPAKAIDSRLRLIKTLSLDVQRKMRLEATITSAFKPLSVKEDPD
jgi:hypothetical protein